MSASTIRAVALDNGGTLSTNREDHVIGQNGVGPAGRCRAARVGRAGTAPLPRLAGACVARASAPEVPASPAIACLPSTATK